jgi:hypothetical protein
VQVITASKLRAVLGRLPGPRVVMSGNFGTPWRALSILDTAVVEYHLFTAGAPVVRGDSLARPARGGRSARADGGHLYDDLRGARSHMLCMRWNLRISSLPANRATATTTATASAAHVVRFIAEPLSVPGANPIAPVTSHGDRSRLDALEAKVRGVRALGPAPELPGPALCASSIATPRKPSPAAASALTCGSRSPMPPVKTSAWDSGCRQPLWLRSRRLTYFPVRLTYDAIANYT